MLIGLFVAFAALFGALLYFAVRTKTRRILLTVLAVAALVPTMVLGLITFGFGYLVNYPGVPAESVTAMVDALGAADFQTADTYVLGSLKLDGDWDKYTKRYQAAAGEQYDLGVEKTTVDGFTATVEAELTAIDLNGWIEELAIEMRVTQRDIVQNFSANAVFNADRTAYLPQVPEQIFECAYDRMCQRSENYTMTVPLSIRLLWTPMGWKILIDEPLGSAVMGCAPGDTEPVTGSRGQHIADRLRDAQTEIVGNMPFIKKIYPIAKDAVQGCEPDPAGFGATDDPADVLKVIDRARELIGDRTLRWNPEIQRKPGSEINYYFDDSILAIQWKESRNNTLVTFAEVIVRDGSQIRRCLSGDRYRCFDYETPEQMAQRTNAVLGVTGDFYMFRGIGIMAYQGRVYRNIPGDLDHLFVTNGGDFIMTKKGELPSFKAEAFVRDNDISFSLAFGPIIIENGEKRIVPYYVVGELGDEYPRGAFGQVDELHYIVMSVNTEGPKENRTVTLAEAQDYMYEKGVQSAYTLDGGNTINITFNGKLTTDAKYAEQKLLSDSFYFASAIPPEER